MNRANLSSIVFCVTLFALVLPSSTLSTHAVTPAYLPAVTPGQFGQYKVLKDSCQSLSPQVCTSLGTSLNNTTYASVQVVGISAPTPSSVTIQLLSIFRNGTSVQRGVLVDVATGASNVTAFSLASNDYLLLAGGLAAPDQIWNTVLAPQFNKTINELVLGSPRNVNFLNYSRAGSYLGVAFKESFVFEFDQSSGFLIDINASLRTVIPGNLEFDFEIAMVDNNVWRTAHIPDFDLSADPTNVNTLGNNSANSSITLHRLYGYSGTVSLTATASASGISCSLSANNLWMGGSDTSILSCRGAPGTYTVSVAGNGGYSAHNTSITVTVSAPPKPTQPTSNLSMPLVYGGIGVAAVVALLVTLLFLRRKPSGAEIATSDVSPSATQA